MIKYDPNIIQTFAEDLYRQARSIVMASTILGVLSGIMGGLALGSAISNRSSDISFVTIVLGAALGGLFGFSAGNRQAFHLKLRAQLALCQVQIEENTRVALPSRQKSTDKASPQLSASATSVQLNDLPKVA